MLATFDEKCFVKKNNQDTNWKVMENLLWKKNPKETMENF
jgi:hypothetical protein